MLFIISSNFEQQIKGIINVLYAYIKKNKQRQYSLMKNVLVIGSTGQIGSELTMKLRNMIPDGNIVAGYIPGAEPKGILLESGPAAEANVKRPAACRHCR